METRVSANLNVPRKFFTLFYFFDRARWLMLALDALFWRAAGTIAGAALPCDDCRYRLRRIDWPSPNRPPDGSDGCRNRQQERLLQQVRGLGGRRDQDL